MLVDIVFGDLVCGLKGMFVVFKMCNFYLKVQSVVGLKVTIVVMILLT